jgi:hypothetical protein
MPGQNSLIGSYTTLLTLTAATVGGNSSPVDLSGFGSGAFVVQTTNFGAGWTPTFQSSADGGTTWANLAAGELGTVSAVGANGAVRYPLLVPSFLGLVRVSYAIASTAVTASVIFAGRHL